MIYNLVKGELRDMTARLKFEPELAEEIDALERDFTAFRSIQNELSDAKAEIEYLKAANAASVVSVTFEDVLTTLGVFDSTTGRIDNKLRTIIDDSFLQYLASEMWDDRFSDTYCRVLETLFASDGNNMFSYVRPLVMKTIEQNSEGYTPHFYFAEENFARLVVSGLLPQLILLVFFVFDVVVVGLHGGRGFVL